MYAQANPAAGIGILPFVLVGLVGGAIASTYMAYRDATALPGEPPAPLPPAAPQTRGQMTTVGAWTPEIMIGQTAREREVFQQGIRSGAEIGRSQRIGTEPAWYENEQLMYAAMAIGGVILLKELRG